MKKCFKYLFILFIFIIILTVICFHSIISAYLSGSEKIDKLTLNTMVRCAISPDKSLALTIKEKNYTIPLPKNSSKINDSTYLSSVNTSELNSYLNNILPSNGWTKVDRNGTQIIIKDKDEKNTFYITLEPFTGSYKKLKFYIIQ